MKKIIFCLLIALTAFTTYNLSQPSVGATLWQDVKMDDDIRPYFIEFVILMEANDIELDWEKVSAINFIPLSKTIQGVYIPSTSVILIQYSQIRILAPEEYNNLILCILAHEIAHSQDYDHVSDSNDLMAFSDIGIIAIIGNKKSVEELILHTYLNLDTYPTYR